MNVINRAGQLLLEALAWRSILDIFLIAFTIFVVYNTLRRMGAWKILLGVLAAALVFFVANLLDLAGIRWIYSNLSAVAVIGFIVIFQPELRKIFERAVSPGRKDGEGSPDLPGLTAEAVFNLAARKEGAIFVFPGKEPLGAHLSGGVDLGAEPSLPLLLSLFDTHSPGHDGAVMVEGGKLTRFGVRLPISTSEILPTSFGTRHQAGMGLSEATDALVIVVSEERGTVSLFREGKIRRARDAEAVKQAIEDHWEETSSVLFGLQGGRKRRTLALEFVASLLVAVVFWYGAAVPQGEIIDKSLSVPIEYTPAPVNLMVAGPKPTEARLLLRGPRSDMDTIRAASLRLTIDLSKARPGRQIFSVDRDNVPLPRQVRLLDVQPGGVTVELMERVEKDAAVTPQVVGSLPLNLQLTSIEVKPAKIRVYAGADSLGNSTESVMTTPIYLESIKRSSTLFCKVIAPSGVLPVEGGWPDLQVSIKVAPAN